MLLRVFHRADCTVIFLRYFPESHASCPDTPPAVGVTASMSMWIVWLCTCVLRLDKGNRLIQSRLRQVHQTAGVLTSGLQEPGAVVPDRPMLAILLPAP